MKKVGKLRCVVCNKGFSPKNYWQKFCSTRCKILGWAIQELRKKGYKILDNPWDKLPQSKQTELKNKAKNIVKG